MGDPFGPEKLRIRQPGKVLPGRASYEISDTHRNLLAVVKETRRRSHFEAIAQEVPNVRTFDVTTARHEPLLTLQMRTGWLAELSDPAGQLVGRIRVSDNRRQYTLLDGQERVVGEAAGDLSTTKFAVNGPAGELYAQVRKTWAGLRKELFTEADNYTVTFTAAVPPRLRPLIVMVPVVLDMSLHGPY